MEELNKEIDDLISYIQNTVEYKKCIMYKEQMSNNSDINYLVNEIKKIQKLYVKSNYDSEKEDIMVPFMNENQGPFIHFAIIEDPNCYTNSVNAAFYGKKSVIGMDREMFYTQYVSRQ